MIRHIVHIVRKTTGEEQKKVFLLIRKREIFPFSHYRENMK